VIELLEDKRNRIVDACIAHGVARLFVFGSILRDDYDQSRSDIDFLVEFSPMDPYQKKTAYFSLFNELCEVLGTDRIDLVMASALKNPYISESIDRTKKILYAA